MPTAIMMGVSVATTHPTTMTKPFAPYRIRSATGLPSTSTNPAAVAVAASASAGDQPMTDVDQEHKYDEEEKQTTKSITTPTTVDPDPTRVLNESQIAFLMQSNLKTPEDILCIHEHLWPKNTTIAPELIQRFKQQVMRPMSGTMMSGLQLSEREQERVRLKLSTQISTLDTILDGGLFPGEVTELVGDSCVGKTQLCLQIAMECARLGESVVVLDTTRTFDVTRAQTIAASQKGLNADDVASMQHIQLAYAETAFELLEKLEFLRHQFSRRLLPIPRLLVIDSCGAVIGPIIGTGKGRGHEIMITITRLIKALALEYNIVVLTTNYSVGNSDNLGKDHRFGDTKPALGDSWLLFADTRLTLESVVPPTSTSVAAHPLSEKKLTRFTLTKSPRQPIGEATICELTAAGFMATL